MVLQGWWLVCPSRHQSKEPADSMGSRRPRHTAWTDGALQPACLFTIGGCQAPAAGGTRVYAREHGLQGAFGLAGGFRLQRREEKSYIHRAEQETQNRARLFPGRSPLDLCLHMAPAYALGSRISCYKTLISLRHAQNSASAG